VVVGEGEEARERERKQGRGRGSKGEERRGKGRGKLHRHVRAVAAMVACARIFPRSEIRSEQSPEAYNCTLSTPVTHIKGMGVCS